jgi:hypothetical protein
MNQRGLQLSFFGPSFTLPSRRFPRYSKAFDEICICTGYERQIIARRTAGGQVLREFVFAENTPDILRTPIVGRVHTQLTVLT